MDGRAWSEEDGEKGTRTNEGKLELPRKSPTAHGGTGCIVVNAIVAYLPLPRRPPRFALSTCPRSTLLVWTRLLFCFALAFPRVIIKFFLRAFSLFVVLLPS